jgi:hypothetical protein
MMVDPLYAGAAAVVGLLFGPFAESTLASLLPARWANGIINPNVKRALSKTDAGWTLHEKEGRRYVWQPISEGEEPDQLVTSDDRMFEDVGLMGHLRIDDTRIAFGCTFDSHRAVTSPLVSAIAEEYGSLSTDAPQVDARLVTDGGTDADGNPRQTPAFRERLTVDYFRDNALLGRGYDSGHIVEVVNGAVGVPRAKVADVKKTENLLAHAGDPEQPVRTAENAENAERARSGPKGAFQKLKGPIYYFGGLLTAYIFLEVLASGGGGGGGGGNIPGPSPGAIDITPVFDVVMGVL